MSYEIETLPTRGHWFQKLKFTLGPKRSIVWKFNVYQCDQRVRIDSNTKFEANRRPSIFLKCTLWPKQSVLWKFNVHQGDQRVRIDLNTKFEVNRMKIDFCHHIIISATYHHPILLAFNLSGKTSFLARWKLFPYYSIHFTGIKTIYQNEQTIWREL